MSALLDEPRIAYASRKVQRFREDVQAWKEEHAESAVAGAWEDLIRDANRLAQDLFALDRLAIEASISATEGDDPARPVVADIVEWATAANRLVDAKIEQRGVEVEGVKELRERLETARQIATARPLERVFQELVRIWKADTLYLSSTTAITNHHAYQRIVRMGSPVVPLILRELRQRPDFWFAALREITGTNPISSDDRGKVQAMADAWVKWGEANRLI